MPLILSMNNAVHEGNNILVGINAALSIMQTVIKDSMSIVNCCVLKCNIVEYQL